MSCSFVTSESCIRRYSIATILSSSMVLLPASLFYSVVFFRQAQQIAGRWHQVLVPLQTVVAFFPHSSPILPFKMPRCMTCWFFGLEGDGGCGRRFGRWALKAVKITRGRSRMQLRHCICNSLLLVRRPS